MWGFVVSVGLTDVVNDGREEGCEEALYQAIS